jgi:hypothetical protein
MPPENYGIVDAHGFELEMGYTGNIGKLAYNVKGNFTYATNKVILQDVAQNVRDVDNPNGRSTDYIKMLVATDLFRTKADLDALPVGYTIYGNKPQIGSVHYEDVSGVVNGVSDGKIDDYDRQFLSGKHSNNPYTFGLNLNAKWKGFGVDIFLQGITGVSKIFGSKDAQRQFNLRPLSYWLDSWSEDNIDAEYPRPVGGLTSQSQLASTFWLMDGSYLRLQNVNLTYLLPKGICKKIGTSDVTFFLSGTNLLTLSKFNYYDPGVAGYDSYPTMKTYTMGINVNF